MQRNNLLASALAVCAILLASAQPLRAEERTVSPRTVTVNGEAEMKIAPDEVILILGVETWDKEILAAKGQNDERVKRVIARTKDFGIESKHVQTDQINVEPRYRDEYTRTELIGFFVRKSIVITLKEVDKFEDLFTAALGAGATNVRDIQFRTTELRKYRDQARALAIQAAREKAIALTGELGQKIGEPQNIQETSSLWWSWYSPRWGGSMSQNVAQNVSGGAIGESGTFAPGQISVSARVTVVFEIK